MKKLYVAAPLLTLVGAWVISSCVGSDGGTGNGGQGGAGPTGQGGATQGMGGMVTGGEGGMTGAGGNVGPTGQGGAGGASPGMGGMTGAGGAMTGAGGAMSGAGGAALTDVAKVLDGQMFLGHCLTDTAASVCSTIAGNCPAPPAGNPDPALNGVLTTNRMLVFGGTVGQMYTVTLHVQGEVESKQYPGGVDQSAAGQSPTLDGFIKGGIPTGADAYNVYMIRVTPAGSTTKTDYFLNSLQQPGVSNHTTYGIDYMAKIQIPGGASIRLVAADSNCSMIKNCGPTVNNGTVCTAPITMQNIEPTAITANPTFMFNTAYNGQWIVLTVKSVTSP